MCSDICYNKSYYVMIAIVILFFIFLLGLMLYNHYSDEKDEDSWMH